MTIQSSQMGYDRLVVVACIEHARPQRIDWDEVENRVSLWLHGVTLPVAVGVYCAGYWPASEQRFTPAQRGEWKVIAAPEPSPQTATAQAR